MQYLPFALILGLPVFSLRLAAEESAPAGVHLEFPTGNHRLLSNSLEQFYQPTSSKRAISGMFGFVRTNGPEPARFFERFHEGLDIKPLARNANGDPLDVVKAAADGKVAYVNRIPGHSNYGIYAVIRHQFGAYEAYTTCGHLASASVLAGQQVKAGDPLGILGHTGPDIPKARAHLHFELGFMYHRDYAEWYALMDDPTDGPNYHGDFNGINFMSVDPAPVLKASAAGDPPTVRQLFAREKHLFTVQVPAAGYCDMQKRFDFLTPDPPADWAGLRSWKIECNRVGLPLKFIASDESIDKGRLIWFKPDVSLQESFTRGIFVRQNGEWKFTRHGRKWVELLAYKADQPDPK